MTSASRRVASSVSAHIYAQVVTIATQLASLPMFLQFWTVEQYGQWLMLSAAPIYLSMADFGLISAAANKVTHLAARGDQRRANVVFQSTLIATLAIFSVVGVASHFAISFINVGFLRLSEAKLALWLLTLFALATAFGGMFDVVFRSVGQYARVTYLLTSARIADFAGMIAGVALYGGIEHAALGGLVARLLSTLVILLIVKKQVSGLQWGGSEASWMEILQLLRPGIGLFAFPLGGAISLQGTVLLVGYLLGPSSAAIFSSYRVLTRTLAQLAVLFGKALWPEVSRLHGQERHGRIDNIYAIASLVNAVGITCAAVILYFSSEMVLAIWSEGKLSYDPALMQLMIGVAALTGMWQIGMVVLAATGRHERLAIAFLAISAASIAVAVPLTNMWDLYGTAWSLLAMEAGLIVATVLAVQSGRRNWGRSQGPRARARGKA